jgi:hypothetical protein
MPPRWVWIAAVVLLGVGLLIDLLIRRQMG